MAGAYVKKPYVTEKIAMCFLLSKTRFILIMLIILWAG